MSSSWQSLFTLQLIVTLDSICNSYNVFFYTHAEYDAKCNKNYNNQSLQLFYSCYQPGQKAEEGKGILRFSSLTFPHAGQNLTCAHWWELRLENNCWKLIWGKLWILASIAPQGGSACDKVATKYKLNWPVTILLPHGWKILAVKILWLSSKF